MESLGLASISLISCVKLDTSKILSNSVLRMHVKAIFERKHTLLIGEVLYF